MPCVFLPPVLWLSRSSAVPAGLVRGLVLLVGLGTLASLGHAPATAAPPAGLAESGVATVPADAAFFFSSLRLKEQFDTIVGSNAFAAIRELPAVKRAFDSWEEQREMPGSPVSMALTFLELPENEQALELLTDMVSTDTFVYGEPSCVAFVNLLRKLSQAQQAGQMLEEGGALDVEEIEMIEEEDFEARVAPLRIIPASRQVELGLEMPLGTSQSEALLEALVDNLDLMVVPEVVWGFKTTKKDAGNFQVKRLEVLARMLVEMNPDLTGALTRKKLPGGEVVTFTLNGGLVPWDDIAADLADELGGSDSLDKVLDRVRDLKVVVAVGMIGDWVILSIGNSIDHLEKLVLPGDREKALVATRSFKPLLEHGNEPLTAIWYFSEPLVEALSAKPEDLDPMIMAVTAAIDADDEMTEEAAAEAEAWLTRSRAEYAAWLPKPAPSMSYSFMVKEGYEGYAWDWAGNKLLDSSSRLDLLSHAGGSPAAVAVSRWNSNPTRLASVAGLIADGWELVLSSTESKMDDDDREKFDAVKENVFPLITRLGEIMTAKFSAALADGQVGFILDGKTKIKKPQATLPASAEPLPILEPAIVLPLADRKLFVEGLNDLFALGDDLVAALRKVDADAVPAGYEIPAPEKEKVEGGSVWSFAIPDAGLDEQIKPSIAVGDKAAVFSLVPSQGARLLIPSKLETGAKLSAFKEPLATAAALDVPALIDTIEPWIVYVTRYGAVQQEEGFVDSETELSGSNETDQVTEALEHVRVVLEAARCLKEAVAETAERDGATVTHWRNLIRDMPKR